MTRSTLLLLLILFTLPTFILRADPDPSAQKAAAEALGAAVVAHEIVYDDQGNVIKIALSNHTGTPRGKAGNQEAPGITPELFERILELPHLQAVAIEKQPVGNDSYALLGQLKNLTDVRLHYMDRDKADSEAPLFINELPQPLTILEIKHNFGIDGGCMESLKPQPELRKLELDTGFATAEALEFITQSPKITNLQMHRTSMSDEEMRTVLTALPNLEILEIKPANQKANPITVRTLQALKHCPNLKVFQGVSSWGDEIVFEGGLDVFVALPNVKEINFRPKGIDNILEHPAIQKLHEARPDILINGKLGGEEGQSKTGIDSETNWDQGVTTHG